MTDGVVAKLFDSPAPPPGSALAIAPSLMPEEVEYRDVTEVAKVTINPGQGLLNWANSEGLKGRSLDQTPARTTGARAGRVVHGGLELMAQGVDPKREDFEPRHRGYVEGLVRWRTSRERTILMSEVRVTSEILRVKGRIDYVRLCQRVGCECGGEGGVLGDLKLGRLQTYSEAHLQVSGYKTCWIERDLFPRICGCEVLTLGANGDYHPYEVLADVDEFVFAALWHARLKPLDDRVREQRRQ